MEINHRAVLGADIIALAVERGGIVQFPKPVEQRRIADFFWIENHPHDFGMTALAGADVLVSRIGHMPAHEAGGHRIHAIDLPQYRLDAPVTARAQSGDFGILGNLRQRGGMIVHRFLVRFAGGQQRQHAQQRHPAGFDRG